jgi:hypothetical protein
MGKLPMPRRKQTQDTGSTKMSHTTILQPPHIASFFNKAGDSHPTRKRIWKGAILMAAVLAVLIVTDVTGRLKDPSHKLALGHDLLPSYAAGLLAREGRPRDMFDRQAISAVEFRVIREADLDIDNRYGPWLNPPFYAWAFAPLSALPYRQAALVFLIINLLLFGLSLSLLSRMLSPSPLYAGERAGVRGGRGSCATREISPSPQPSPPSTGKREPSLTGIARFDNRRAIKDATLDWKTFALVPLLVLLPLPFWQVMGHQQNTCISLLLLVGAVICWRKEKAFSAGLIAGLLFFKPQLAAVFAAVLVIALGWRALAGLAVTGIILLMITLITMPGCLGDFFYRLPPILHWLQIESPYNWGRQVTFQSFWRLLIQGQVRGETVGIVKVLWCLSCAAMAALVGLCAWRFRTGPRDGVSRDRLIAASVVAMPMIMPYFMDYDLLLLAIPPVLLAAEWIHRPELITPADRWLLATWAVFFVESHINPGLAGHSRFNLGVPLLLVISLLHIGRTLRGKVVEVFPSTKRIRDGAANNGVPVSHIH